MVYALLSRSNILRTGSLPNLGVHAFTRQRSITQAIEAGKHRAFPSTRFSPPSRPQQSHDDDRGYILPRLKRAARRREQFGSTPAQRKKERESAELGSNESTQGGSTKAFSRRGSAASSRFGRVGSVSGKDEDLPSRREHGHGKYADREHGHGKYVDRRVELGDGESGRTSYARRGDRSSGEASAGRSYDARRTEGVGRHPDRRLYGGKNREDGEQAAVHHPYRSTRSEGDQGHQPYGGKNGGDGEHAPVRHLYRSTRSEGDHGDPGHQPYGGKNGGDGEHAPVRHIYRSTRSEGDHGDPGHRPYGGRNTQSDDKGSDRRPYGRISTQGGERASDRRPAGRTREVDPSSRHGPESFPYTTAASEFIYGHSSVLAAIKANRRKLYKLYVHSQRGSRDGFMAQVRAHRLFEITSEVGDEYLRAMDKASTGRPHNGLVLEASPLPVPPVVALKTPSIVDQSFGTVFDTQSAEDALVNGNNELYSYKSAGWRHPLVLYVDGVLDEGNLGAMARSAYFLGVDAIITSTHHIAPWSHVALKASAGAAEAIPIFKVGKPADFLTKSSQAGWRIYASNSGPSSPLSMQSSTAKTPEMGTNKVVYTLPKSSKRLDADHCPVAEAPTILMMGAEATGLKNSLSNLAHYNVGIPHGRHVNEVGVDSLNVSVAASLLCYEMLQRPKAKPDRNPENLLF